MRRLLTSLAVIIGATVWGFAGSAGAVSAGTDVRADAFRLLNAATDQCADLSTKSTTGREVEQQPCTGQPTQVWVAQPVPATPLDVQLVNRSSALCMDLLAGGKGGDPALVVQAPCSAKLLSQQWLFVTVGGVPGPVRVVNRALGGCLEVKDGSLVPGAPIQVSTCLDSADHQVWHKLDATRP